MQGLLSGLFEELKPQYNLFFVEREVAAVCHSLYIQIDFFFSLGQKWKKKHTFMNTFRQVQEHFFNLIFILTL